MHLELLSEEAINSTSLCYKLRLPKKDFQFFAYLLDSIDNLGTHSSTGVEDEMQVFLPHDLKAEWLGFVDCYQGFEN